MLSTWVRKHMETSACDQKKWWLRSETKEKTKEKIPTRWRVSRWLQAMEIPLELRPTGNQMCEGATLSNNDVDEKCHRTSTFVIVWHRPNSEPYQNHSQISKSKIITSAWFESSTQVATQNFAQIKSKQFGIVSVSISIESNTPKHYCDISHLIVNALNYICITNSINIMLQFYANWMLPSNKHPNYLTQFSVSRSSAWSYFILGCKLEICQFWHQLKAWNFDSIEGNFKSN